MMLGMSFSTFTMVHVIISLIGIASGIIVLFGMLEGRKSDGWTALFLVTTVLTSVTGFLFPFSGLLPSHVVGIISLVVLAAALAALYGFQLSGAWRWIYVIAAVLALYLNVFVGVVQAFRKVGFLQSLAPTESELPFVVAQTLVLAAFAVLGYLAIKRFHPEARALV